MPAPRVLRLLPPGGALPQAFRRSFRRHAPRASKRAGAGGRSGPSAATSPRRGLVPCHVSPAGPCSLPAAMPLNTVPPLRRYALESGTFVLCRSFKHFDVSGPQRPLCRHVPGPSPKCAGADGRSDPSAATSSGGALSPATFPRRASSFLCRLAPGGTLVLREHDVSRETLHVSGRILSIRAPASAERPSRRALRANSPSRRGDHRRCRSNGLSHG